MPSIRGLPVPTEEEMVATVARIKPTHDLQDLADCNLIIEAIAEDLEIKRSLFAELTSMLMSSSSDSQVVSGGRAASAASLSRQAMAITRGRSRHARWRARSELSARLRGWDALGPGRWC